MTAEIIPHPKAGLPAASEADGQGWLPPPWLWPESPWRRSWEWLERTRVSGGDRPRTKHRPGAVDAGSGFTAMPQWVCDKPGADRVVTEHGAAPLARSGAGGRSPVAGGDLALGGTRLGLARKYGPMLSRKVSNSQEPAERIKCFRIANTA